MANGIVLNIDTTKSDFQNPMVQLRQGDGNYQSLDVTVTSNGEPFDLTGWTTMFMGTTAGGFKIVDSAVTVTNALQGEFTYTPTKAWGQDQGEFKNAYFKFTKADETASGANFRVKVFEAVDLTDEEAGNYISVVDVMIDKLTSDMADLVTNVNDLKSQNLNIKTSDNTWTGKNTFNTPIVGSVTGSSAKLQTPRKINGTPFDGTSDITITGSGALAVGGVYPTLADLIAANPDLNRTYITTNNGNWNYWNGTTWVAGGIYQATAIGDETIVSKNVSYITPRDIRDTYANDKNISGWNLPASFTSLNHTIMFTGSAGDNGVLIPVDLPDGVTYADDLTISFSYMTSRVDSPAASFSFLAVKDGGVLFNSRARLVTMTQTTTMTKVTARVNLKSLTYADIPSHFNILIAIGGDYTVTIKDLYLNKNGVSVPFSEQIKSLDIKGTTNGDNNIIPSAVNWGPIRKTVLSDGTLLFNNDYDGKTITSINSGIRFNTFWDGVSDLYVTVKMTGSPISKTYISLINSITGAITGLNTNEFMVSQGIYENSNDNKVFVIKKSKLVSLGFNTSNTWILVSSSGNSWFHIKDITASSSMGFSKTRDTTNSILENTTVRQEASFGQSPRLLELSKTTTNSNYDGLELGTPSDAPLFTKDVYLKDVTIYSPIDTTVYLRVGSIDQNNLFVNNTWNIPILSVKAGLNTIRYEKSKFVISAGQRMFIGLNNVGMYTPTADVPLFSKALIRDTTHALNDGAYSGNQLYKSDKIVPFSYTVVEKSLSDRANEVDAKIQSISESVDTVVPFMDNIFIKSASGKKFFLKVDENGNLTTKTTIPSHVVAFGNSLTYNWGNFGLAASNPNSDWFAHIKDYVTNVNQNATFNRFGLGQWENATTTADRNTVFTKDLAPQLTPDTDLVIIQLGDNINTTEKNATFRNDASQLIKNIKLSSPNATIAWIGLWYQTFGNLIGDIKNATDTNNAIFVDISAIPRMSGTTSYLGAVQTDADGNTRVIDNTGRSSHPGDKGHQLIAEAVTRKLQF